MAVGSKLRDPVSRRRFLAVGGGPTAAAAFLAACGSDDDDGGTSSEGSSSSGGGTVGGNLIVGNQFGDGTGREVATAVGAVAGASVARHRANQIYKVEYKLVELLIETDSGHLVDVIQDVDPNMLFSRGDKVRILYFDNGVRVDKTY